MPLSILVAYLIIPFGVVLVTGSYQTGSQILSGLLFLLWTAIALLVTIGAIIGLFISGSSASKQPEKKQESPPPPTF